MQSWGGECARRGRSRRRRLVQIERVDRRRLRRQHRRRRVVSGVAVCCGMAEVAVEAHRPQLRPATGAHVHHAEIRRHDEPDALAGRPLREIRVRVASGLPRGAGPWCERWLS